jgi:hypothetical protein
MPLIRAMRENRNQAVIEKGERPRFSWGPGIAGKRTPDRVLLPEASRVPFRRLIDLLRGDPSTTEIRRFEGPVVYRFDWTTWTLRSPEGGIRFQLQGRWIRDWSGSAVHEWDGLYLRRSGEGTLYEVRTETIRGPARKGGRLAMATVAPVSFGCPERAGTVIRSFGGPSLYEWDPPRLLRFQGEALYEFEDPIPLGLAIMIAEGWA